MIVSKHIQAAPATAYALDLVAQMPNRNQALVLMTVAAMADRDLYSGDGYGGHDAEQVDVALGLSSLAMGGVEGVTEILQALLRTKVLIWGLYGKYRIPQDAYDRSNEA